MVESVELPRALPAIIIDDPEESIPQDLPKTNKPEGQGSTGYARGGMRIRPKGVERSSNPSECHGLCPWVSTLIVLLSESPQTPQLLPHLASMTETKAVIAPIDN